MYRLLLALLGFLLCAPSLTAQAQSHPQKASQQVTAPAVSSTSQEVVLDMVFRDRKGRPVLDIRPGEVHVLEDGVEQKLTSFRLMHGKTALSSKESEAAVPQAAVAKSGSIQLNPMRQVRLVTLVFQGLDADGKRFFREALKEILNMAPQQNLYFSIYVVDQRLQCIQPFTNDHDELLKSAKRSAMWSFLEYSKHTAQVEQNLMRTVTQGEPQLFNQMVGTGGPTVQAGSNQGPSQSQLQNYVDWNLAKTQYDMLQIAGSENREYDARSTINALLALVQGEAELPGRKAVLYFNPSLYIPDSFKEEYQYMISAANRANVTFDTVDPKGLVTWSQGGQGENMLNGAAAEVRAKQMRGGVGAVTRAEARSMDTAIEGIRSNPLLWLRDLSRQTGGFTIANTNDTRAPLSTVMDELRTYYEATYIPRISTYNGEFRRISVRVDRPGVKVLTRSGYFALPPVKGGQHVLAYEVPLLKAVSTSPVPRDVTFSAAAERFNQHGPNIAYMLTLQAPLDGLKFVPQKDHKTAVVDAALLAVVKNAKGEIVKNFSKDFAVRVPLKKIDQYKTGDLIQSFQTGLPPGEYTLEAVVMDRNNNKIGVQESQLTVPQPSNKLAISNVVVVRRTEAVKKGKPVSNPFYYPGGEVEPRLTHTLKGGPGNVLPFYFVVYPDPAIKDAPRLVMHFYKEGQYLGAAQAPLPKAQDGRIPYIADLPAGKFTPGSYEIRLDVVQGEAKAEEKVDFKVD
ncbi:MAG: VWA domain-containing protein [Acidobacteriota bacterium]